MKILIDAATQKLSVSLKTVDGLKRRSQNEMIGTKLQSQKKSIEVSILMLVVIFACEDELPYHILDFLHLEWLANPKF
jgi:hypothetical protein